MKVSLYKDLYIENKVKVQADQEAVITNQVLHYSHVNINGEEKVCEGNSVFYFEEDFGQKGLKTSDGRLNVKLNFIYKVPGEAHIYNQVYFASLKPWQLFVLRKSFGKIWWQDSDNIKWILSFIIALTALVLSIINIK